MAMTQHTDSESPRPKLDLSALSMDETEREPPRRRLGLLAAILLPLVAIAVLVIPRLDLPFLLPEVETTTVQSITPTQSQTVLTATGYTYARTRAAVGSKIIGRVVDLRVDEGDRVRRGDVITVLDSDDLRAALRQAEARLAEAEARLVDAEREFGRQERLVDAGINAQAAYDSAETQLGIARATVDTAQAAVDSVNANLAYTVIHSPIDGVVIERNVEVGEMVAPGGFTSQQSTGAIVRLADPQSLEVEADVNESYVSRLVSGMPARIKVDAVPDHTYNGELRQIVPTADRQRAVVEVKVTIDDRDERLVPDMSCSVTFLEEGTDRAALDAEPRLMVAGSALLYEGGEVFVYRVTEGRLRKVRVDVSEGDGAAADMVQVTGGVAAGDVLVRRPTAELSDGLDVRVAG